MPSEPYSRPELVCLDPNEVYTSQISSMQNETSHGIQRQPLHPQERGPTIQDTEVETSIHPNDP